MSLFFTAAELTRQLQYGPGDEISVADAEQTEEIVAGWLADATDLTDFPKPLPKELRAWGLELGGIAFENPTSMERDQSGEINSGWWDRRRQILDAARAWAQRRGHATRTPKPRGSFPPAVPLPDPATPRGW